MSDRSIKFSCDRCGLCCRLISKIPQLAAFDRGDGVCIHLRGTLCDIYEQRPDICNVEKMYDAFSARMSYREYIEMMEKSCEILKRNFAELVEANKNNSTP